MTTVSSLVDRMRMELGDIGKSFVDQFVADGTTNRFKIHHSPLDAASVYIWKNGTDITDTVSVEESSGVLVFDTVPLDGDDITVSGNYYRYFTAAEATAIIETALVQHSTANVDSLGRSITASKLPFVEEYPVVIYATSLALFTLATDASFDIDIQAPDGVSIPRAQRYRQLMEMVQTRKDQYRELCTQLNIGLYSVDVYSLRRISKTTGRLVPVYKPQEVDDRSYPERVALPQSTYGDKPVEWPTTGGELTAYQNKAFTTTVDFSGDFTGKSFLAKVLPQRGSVLSAQNFTLSVADNNDGTFTATMSLTKAQTLSLAKRTYWSLISVDDVTAEKNEILGDHFFTIRELEVII